jgi:hypothetical protein
MFGLLSCSRNNSNPDLYFKEHRNRYFPLKVGNYWKFKHQKRYNSASDIRTADDFVGALSEYMGDSLSFVISDYIQYNNHWFVNIHCTYYYNNKMSTRDVLYTYKDSNEIHICEKPLQFFKASCATLLYKTSQCIDTVWSVNSISERPIIRSKSKSYDIKYADTTYSGCLVFHVERGEWCGADILAKDVGPIKYGDCELYDFKVD